MMETNYSLILDLLIHFFGTDHIFWIFYILNLVFGSISFKLGFARELPILKTIIVYIMLAIGTFILTIFSIMNLPITESLILIALVLGIYRYRLHKQRTATK
ncbi:YlaH-like family protein [Virgibacillus halodenitrificans]|nr:YlaH-like family protein [Virgibacillus halodenitrificans]MEC2161118.1 YlaH-like family protein [Virgibacillus halodenitrificans]